MACSLIKTYRQLYVAIRWAQIMLITVICGRRNNIYPKRKLKNFGPYSQGWNYEIQNEFISTMTFSNNKYDNIQDIVNNFN